MHHTLHFEIATAKYWLVSNYTPIVFEEDGLNPQLRNHLST